MDKSKSLKKALISVLIFGVVALLAWGALFVVLGLGTQTKDGIPFFKLHFSQLIAVLGFPNNKYYLPLAFTILGLLALAAIFLILMIVFSAVKRRGIMVLPFIVYLVATFGMWELFANFGRYTIADTTTKSGYTAFIESASLSKTIMTIALIACLFIAFVLAFIAFILSFVHACKYPGGKARVSKNELEEVNVEGEPGKFEEEPEPEQEPAKDEKAELIEMIKELIRQEVRGGQQSNQTVTGATFAAPLIVQYFNGTNPTGPQQNVQPAPAEEKKEEPQPEPEKKPEPKLELVVEPEPYEEPAPVKPEPVKEPEPQPEPEPEPQPEPEPAPVVEEPVQPVVVAPAPEPEPEKKPIIRIPFEERMVSADKEMKDNYNEIKNEILSYGVKSRVSNSGDTFRLHRKTYIKLTIAGKSLKLYFALNPDDYKDTTIPVQDASEKGIYEEIPLVFKVKSGLSMKRCKQLIADVMEKDNLTQGEIGKVNWAKEIAASLKEGKKAEKEEKDD